MTIILAKLEYLKNIYGLSSENYTDYSFKYQLMKNKKIYRNIY